MEKENRGLEQAKAQYETIKEMVQALKEAQESDNDTAIDEARETIENDALSICVCSGWQVVGEKLEPTEYEILLCTGGPACRIIGELNRYNEPETAVIQYQDWFTPWEEYEEVEEEILIDYARVFYFGE